jgi:hypothetical protein
MRWARAWCSGLLAAVGCSETTPPVDTCPPPNRLVAARCLEPGVQDDGCPAGTLGLEDGSCQPAGVPPELCAEGFVHDGDAACEPILPAAPCPKGQMAIPGESECHPVMACGTGTWGDIPVDGATIYVDASYVGGSSDGSQQRPWTTISEAVGVAAPGALVAVAAGSYVEDVVVAKRIRLHGVCPGEVEVVGTAAGLAALEIRSGASASELRGLAITGERIGVLASGVEDVVLEHLWVHDALVRGVNIESSLGATSVTLRSSLVEDNSTFGVRVAGSELTFDGLVVRGTLPRASDQQYGNGIAVQSDPNTGAPSSAHGERSVVEANRDSGVVVSGSQATLEGLVVRGTLPRATDETFGVGIHVLPEPNDGAPASVHVGSSLVAENRLVGVLVLGSEAILEGVVVRDTLPQASDQWFGRGIGIESDATGAPARAQVLSSSVENNHDVGVLVFASEATLDGVVVSGTLPRASDQFGGTGIAVQVSLAGAASTGLVRRSRVADNHAFGLFVAGSQATVEATLVRGTQLQVLDGVFGDGLVVATFIVDGVPLPADAIVTTSRAEANARAGLAAFGAHVALGGSALACNAFELDGENAVDLPNAFDNLGGNGCGCPAPTGECVARSSGLAPPEAIADSP